MNQDPHRLECAKICLAASEAFIVFDAKMGAVECAKRILECTGSDPGFQELREEVHAAHADASRRHRAMEPATMVRALQSIARLPHGDGAAQTCARCAAVAALGIADLPHGYKAP